MHTAIHRTTNDVDTVFYQGFEGEYNPVIEIVAANGGLYSWHRNLETLLIGALFIIYITIGVDTTDILVGTIAGDT